MSNTEDRFAWLYFTEVWRRLAMGGRFCGHCRLERLRISDEWDADGRPALERYLRTHAVRIAPVDDVLGPDSEKIDGGKT